jgi:hypothetical protein
VPGRSAGGDRPYSRSVILAAGLLVLLGLGLFVAGVLTGVTAFYWGCVAVCLMAAVLLFLARNRASTPTAADAGPPAAERTGPGEQTESAAGTRPEPSGAAAASAAEAPADTPDPPDPPVEDVEVTDLLLVVDLRDEVLVIDEHPRYHVAGCAHLAGRPTIPLPLDEARADGFTPCAICAPDRTLAQRVRERRAAGS